MLPDKDKNKHADASDKNADLDKEPKKTEEVVTGVIKCSINVFFF
ncbi:MAG: hypothetical protein ACLTTH_16180 [Holdemanella porci]